MLNYATAKKTPQKLKKTIGAKKTRYIECLLLFFIVPCLLYFFRYLLAFRIMFFLAGLSLICAVILLKDPEFDPKILWNKIPLAQIKSITAIFFPGAVILTVVAYTALPLKFLDYPFSQPGNWMATMLFYPLLLVIPQEFLFRCFFFHRYRRLFTGNNKLLMLLNALSFGLAHLFYGNWIAPVLSFFGGLLFAWRYQRTKDLFTVSLEHAIWGNFLFTIGIGWFFYSGSIS